jgi:MFS family permease
MKEILRQPDVRRLLLATALSTLGDQALWLALGIWVKTLTGSNAAAGMVFFAFTLPSLFGPLSGYVVDRSRKRSVLRIANAATLLLVCGLFLVSDRHAVWLIYLVVLGQGAAYTFLGSASSALLRALLPDEQLAAANGVRQTGNELMRLLSPLAGAGLFSLVGPRAVIAFQLGAYAVAAVLLLRLRTAGDVVVRERLRWHAEVAAGVRHVWTTLPLRQLVGSIGVVLLVVGFLETISFALVTEGLHRSASYVGVVFMAQGLAAVPGGLTAGAAVRRLGELRAAGLGMSLIAAGSAVCIEPQTLVVVLGVALLGFGVPWVVVALFTAVQKWTPADLQGRVYSASDTLISTPQTISIALGAGLSAVVDYRVLLAVIGVVVAVCATYLATRRRVEPGAAVAPAPPAPPAPPPGQLAAPAH